MTWLIDFDGYTLKNAPSLKVCWTAAPALRASALCHWLSPAWKPCMLVVAVCEIAVFSGLTVTTGCCLLRADVLSLAVCCRAVLALG